MHRPLGKLAIGAAALIALATSFTVASASATTHTTWKVTPVVIPMAAPYKPNPPAGSTDDYHCSLIDPKVTHNSFITESDFNPGDFSKGSLTDAEVHHAILFLIPPAWAAAAEAADNGGKGWTCFGETVLTHEQLQLPGSSPSTGQPTWLTAWAPGHNVNVWPKGTGTYFPKGSLVVLQIHYNTLAGDLPIQSTLTLDTVSAKDPLKPLSLDLYPAPPDIPCLASLEPCHDAAVQPRELAQVPRSALRSAGRQLRGRTRGDLRQESRQPARGRHDAVHVDGAPAGQDRRARRAHAPHGRQVLDHAQSWASIRRCCSTSRTSTSTTNAATT